MNASQTSDEKCYQDAMISVDQAREFMLSKARPLGGSDAIATTAALGRIVAQAAVSAIDVPGYANSSMDGYAVRSSDFDVSSHRSDDISLLVAQRVAAGQVGSRLQPGEAARIFTGAPIPDGADAVVMQENCTLHGQRVTVHQRVAAGENVRPRGNDIQANSCVLPAGLRLRAQDLGLAASVGLAELKVRHRPRVALLSSGNELALPGQPLGPGQIYNSNRCTLHGLLQALGCEVRDFGLIPDAFEETVAALRTAADTADLVLSSGGVSVGEEDYIKRAVEHIGTVDMWRVAVKPGKPLTFGRIGDADFVGLPGNPVSVLVTFCLFVRPFILRRLGVQDVLAKSVRVRADFSWAKAAVRREYARARLSHSDAGESIARLHPKQGSDVLTSANWADGLVEILEGTTIVPGDLVSYFSFTELMS